MPSRLVAAGGFTVKPRTGRWIMGNVTARDIRKYLQGLVFPATRVTVMEQARRNGAPADVLQSLARLPGGEWHGFEEIIALWERNNPEH